MASEDKPADDVCATLGIADQNAVLAVGEFASDEWTSLYGTLVSMVKVSLKAAGGVGVNVEKMDIAELDRALAANPAADISRVPESLPSSSTRHLAAFERVVSGGTGVGMGARR